MVLVPCVARIRERQDSKQFVEVVSQNNSIVLTVWQLLATTSEKAMVPHSSTLAWRIPWTEEPGRLQSMGLRRFGHNWVTSLSCIGEGNGNPLQCSCLQNPRDGGAWWAAVSGVAQSRTRLKRLSSSSKRDFKRSEKKARRTDLQLKSDEAMNKPWECRNTRGNKLEKKIRK